MAALDELINQIEDEAFRERIRAEVKRANKQKKFGLVFEQHLPEATPLYDVPVKKGSVVTLKGKSITDIYLVEAIANEEATCLQRSTKERVMLPVKDLVSVAQFGEPIYPYLQPIDSVCNAPDSDLWHTLIEADNYHALQLLEYLYAGKVDCIYIDPPYNTGAKDWKYNNDYVDSVDGFRHSKWLSMMEKRLRLAKKLLKKTGMLITTIDDNEFANLYLLIEELFPECINTTITIQMNPGGTQGKAFSVTNEYAIVTYFKDTEIYKKKHEGGDTYNLRRWGSTSNRYEGATCFYPVILNSQNEVVGFGEVLPDEQHPSAQVELLPDGNKLAWPIDINNTEKKWRYARDTVESVRRRMIIEEHGKRIEILLRRETEPPKTVWVDSEYNAEAYGTRIVKQLIGKDRFSYPKSLYATKDSLYLGVAEKKDALIVDFFAGSGTTLHAVNLLNAEDGGHRRCIIVTNNEVSAEESKKLKVKGYQPGDFEWDNLGVARYVTWPRTVCSIEGHDINGEPLKGDYLGGDPAHPRAMAEGFAANAAFFKLGFLDKTAVSLGRKFREMLPVMWMKAGARGPCPSLEGDEIPPMMILPENQMAVLNEEWQYEEFAQKVNADRSIRTVFLITDSETSYKEMAAGLRKKETHQLYREYLDSFRINQGGKRS